MERKLMRKFRSWWDDWPKTKPIRRFYFSEESGYLPLPMARMIKNQTKIKTWKKMT